MKKKILFHIKVEIFFIQNTYSTVKYYLSSIKKGFNIKL